MPDKEPEDRRALQDGAQTDLSASALTSRGVVVAAHATFRSGPLPTAQELADYERASPGAALWILNEAEKSASHFRDMERHAIRIEGRDALLRRLLPFLVVLTFLVGSVLIALFASTIAGIAAFAGTLASVVLVYLKGPAIDAGQLQEESDPGG